jgi:hypothetical protein
VILSLVRPRRNAEALSTPEKSKPVSHEEVLG